MVEFWSSNYLICRQLCPTVSVLEKECAGRKNGVTVWKIDASRPENKALAQSFRIRDPTFVVLNRKDQKVSRLIGFQRLSTLRQFMSLLTGQSRRSVGLLSTANHTVPSPYNDSIARISVVECPHPLCSETSSCNSQTPVLWTLKESERSFCRHW